MVDRRVVHVHDRVSVVTPVAVARGAARLACVIGSRTARIHGAQARVTRTAIGRGIAVLVRHARGVVDRALVRPAASRDRRRGELVSSDTAPGRDGRRRLARRDRPARGRVQPDARRASATPTAASRAGRPSHDRAPDRATPGSRATSSADRDGGRAAPGAEARVGRAARGRHRARDQHAGPVRQRQLLVPRDRDRGSAGARAAYAASSSQRSTRDRPLERLPRSRSRPTRAYLVEQIAARGRCARGLGLRDRARDEGVRASRHDGAGRRPTSTTRS